MNKILGISLVALMASSGAFAQMAPKMYAGFGLGYTIDTEIEDSTFSPDENVNLSLSYGAQITDAFRVEAEYAYYAEVTGEPAVGTSIDYTNTTYMINGYYSLPIKSAVKPYLGLGLGYSHKTLEITYTSFPNEEETGDAFAYQFMGGVDFELPNSPMTIGLEYRYMMGDFESNSDNVTTQSVAAKLRYAF